ncbi:unnamed protein product [Peronospora belbahrii]|uniref:No apical meristem-associated C-terminal domain-containing protein n=1 Tax=Peronospora belbahrii TaxID=622444 RepID=A0AAU9KV17_9STRA|nr:unnamed protein product [Peronospora belbahrii]CAH0515081.1 unnamed protein product [Peronospora belbahrii]
MGKKTNWTTTEDQTLCRVWLNASDLQLHGVEQKASNFWNVVMELFHQEMESPVERPLNGLKVRWTRINRDSQKFASIFNELQNKRIKEVEENGGESSEAVELLTEQPWIDDAKVMFHRIYNAKFSFEACWKQLRYSAKWVQLFANSSNYPVMAINTLPSTPTATMGEEPTHTEASSDTSSETEISTTANPPTTSPEPSVKTTASLPIEETATSSIDVVDVAPQESDETTFNVPPNHKRRADVSLESYAQLSNQNELQGLTAALIEELKRQNELMEDQNTISLLKINGEMILDADTRQCYRLLRARYLEKARNNSSRTSTIV